MPTQQPQIAVVFYVEDYAEKPSAMALAADGFTVLGHSPRFVDESTRREYEREHPGHVAAGAQTPEALIEEATGIGPNRRVGQQRSLRKPPFRSSERPRLKSIGRPLSGSW